MVEVDPVVNEPMYDVSPEIAAAIENRRLAGDVDSAAILEGLPIMVTGCGTPHVPCCSNCRPSLTRSGTCGTRSRRPRTRFRGPVAVALRDHRDDPRGRPRQHHVDQLMSSIARHPPADNITGDLLVAAQLQRRKRCGSDTAGSIRAWSCPLGDGGPPP